MRIKKHGFSLVELSIVLVILGLLVGGILGGQSLIKAAELRSVITDRDKFTAAINAFRGKYNQIPGDMSNATDYWGAAHATPATCKDTVGTGTQTCNGDGDGKVNLGPYATTYEIFNLWEHLSNAGLIEGKYSHTFTAGFTVGGFNVPKSKISGGLFEIMSMDFYVSGGTFSVFFYPGDYKNVLYFGTNPYGMPLTDFPIISPEDAFYIDSKIDDGRPAYGQVLAEKSNSPDTPGCTTTAVAATAAYSVSNPAILCSLLFKMGF